MHHVEPHLLIPDWDEATNDEDEKDASPRDGDERPRGKDDGREREDPLWP